MSVEKKQSGFSHWYNSPGGQRLVGAVYSLGAAVVIIGALFKLMHWPFAGAILTAGMITEAILFGIGVFEKPHKTYAWDKVFSFDGKHQMSGGVMPSGGVVTQTTTTATMQAPTKLAETEMLSLTDGIKNLSATAKQLSTLSAAIGNTSDFARNIESATEATAKYTTAQTALSNATGKLFASYDSLNADMNTVVNGTKQHADKVENINKNLSSLNSVYEIQLKNIQSQSTAISAQTENTRLMAQSLSEIVAENQKIKQSTKLAVEEATKYKDASAQLVSQISELNKVYGNMLNALS